MKRPIAIYRMGVENPTKGDFLLMIFCAGVEEGIDPSELDAHAHCGFNVPGGMVSMTMTDKTPRQIAKKMFEIGKKTKDAHPVIVFRLDDPESWSFEGILPLEKQVDTIRDHINTFLKMNDLPEIVKDESDEPSPPKKKQVFMSMDELLDIVAEKGMDGLSSEEKELLEELSKKHN